MRLLLALLLAAWCGTARAADTASEPACLLSIACPRVPATAAPAARTEDTQATPTTDLSSNLRGTTIPGRLVPLGYQQITSLSSATSLTVPSGATIAIIRIAVAAVRYRDDGTAPTSSVGVPVYVAETLTYSGALGSLQLIQQATGAVADISYYR